MEKSLHEFEDKFCFVCSKMLEDNSKIFCNKKCYSQRKKYNNHTNETKQKIAFSNSKPLTEERKRNISIAKTKIPTIELLKKLDSLWKLKYINPQVIRKIVNISSRFYQRLKKQYCKYEQYTCMPSNWYPEHYQKLIVLSNQNIWFVDIAKQLGFGKKQVFNVSKKLGLSINRKMPNPWSSVTSKFEKAIVKWIEDAGYNVMTQFQLGNFRFDGYILNSNILIEANGDYWHANPIHYKNKILTEKQKANVKRDFAKKFCAKENGYYQITVWEHDYKVRPDEIKAWLLEKIKKEIKHEN